MPNTEIKGMKRPPELTGLEIRRDLYSLLQPPIQRQKLTPEAHYYNLVDGKANHVHALITKDMLGTGTPADYTIQPPGLMTKNPNDKHVKKGLSRGHLLASSLGGAGDDKRNIITIIQYPVNSPIMSGFEESVKSAVLNGYAVDYDVKATYDNPNNELPDKIIIEAIGFKAIGFKVKEDGKFILKQTILNNKPISKKHVRKSAIRNVQYYNFVNGKAVHALITKDMLSVGTAVGAFITISHPDLIDENGKVITGLDRGHLLAKSLGGDGEDFRNIVPIYHYPVNTPIMSGFEASVKSAVLNGYTVDYYVEATYDTNSALPDKILIEATVYETAEDDVFGDKKYTIKQKISNVVSETPIRRHHNPFVSETNRLIDEAKKFLGPEYKLHHVGCSNKGEGQIHLV